MDTVQLDGEHFKAHVSQGDHIEKGQLLIEFNIMAIEKAGYDIITPVVITNYDQYEKIEVGDPKNIEIGQSLIKLESKTNNQNKLMNKGEKEYVNTISKRIFMGRRNSCEPIRRWFW